MTTARDRLIITADEPTTDETSTIEKPMASALNPTDAAIYIDMSPAFLAKTRRFGGGPVFLRIGRTVRYLRTDLDAWLQTKRVISRLTRS